jgi:hypothetical protein
MLMFVKLSVPNTLCHIGIFDEINYECAQHTIKACLAIKIGEQRITNTDYSYSVVD